ncbi:MAG: dipeptidase, partial [Bacteroidales bacterium]|nr:dipeptidase [Bacteroidales bacterium]
MNRYILILFIAGLFITVTSCGNEEARLIAKADRIHNSMLTVDTHCDTPMRLVRSDYDLGVRNDNGCVDFPRMKEGGLDAEFFVVFIGQGPRVPEFNNEAHAAALTIFDAIHKNVEKNSDQAELAYSVDDAYRISKSGKSVAFIGMENGYPIGNDLTRIKQYYDLGARYITLSHSRNNDICDSSTDPGGPEFNGLSGFGVEVVKEMNRLGMMVDVSHISDEASYDVLETTKAPVIASHSSCRAICESPRNLE